MKCAYVTLVMLGDSYVKGAIALAKSLIKSGTCHDLVCLVTNDVTKIENLNKVFTKIIQVPYMYFKCGKMLTKRQEELYTKWIDFSFTKWRCFQLTMYDRCVYLDADQIVLKNIDHLFKHRYAMCFDYNYNPHYKIFKYGNLIDYNVQKFIFENYDFLGFTGTFVFTPSLKIFNRIDILLTPSNLCITNTNKYNNGFDEIVLTQALIAEKINVTQLSPLYIWNAGDYSVLKNFQQPYIINYYGDKKPWLKNITQYMDVYIWKYFYNHRV
ncbi:P13 [Choristoneura occidentalis granulovirus]|uniref:P13 n=1 Tax=Choristoneura occidentalis granulovirus TaxID=364745 RepID=Q1A4R2_9BBAC|nr:P13 [Choristoneura fumiferana granulovirus]ABC61168.1 P13 [Choristoneura fumiferana granulovirus]